MVDQAFNRVCDIIAMSETFTDTQLDLVISNEPEYILLGLIPLVTSFNLMKSLAHDPRSRIRQTLTENIYLTSEILEMLSLYKEKETLEGIAKHTAVNENLLVTLSKHVEASVRFSAVNNPKLPIVRLYKMLDDKSYIVTRAAAAMLKQRPDSDYFDLPDTFKDYGLRMFSVKDFPSEFCRRR